MSIAAKENCGVSWTRGGGDDVSERNVRGVRAIIAVTPAAPGLTTDRMAIP